MSELRGFILDSEAHQARPSHQPVVPVGVVPTWPPPRKALCPGSFLAQPIVSHPTQLGPADGEWPTAEPPSDREVCVQ